MNCKKSVEYALVLSLVIALMSVNVQISHAQANRNTSAAEMFRPIDRNPFKCLLDPTSPGCEDLCPPNCLLVPTSTKNNAMLTVVNLKNDTSAEAKTVIGTPDAIKASAIKEIGTNTAVNSTSKATLEKNLDGLIKSANTMEQFAAKPSVTVKCEADSTGKVTCSGSITITW